VIEGSRRLRLPDFKTDVKVVSPTHRPPLSPGNISCTHFCESLNRPQFHVAAGMIMTMNKSHDSIGIRTHDLPACSPVPLLS
jgi:hypothetical protein